MSDPKTSYGEPVEEPRPVDDVVGRAEEGLADAEAAGRDAVGEEPVVVEPVDTTPPDAAPVVDAEPEYTTAADYQAAFGYDDEPAAAAPPVATAAPVADAPTVVAAPIVEAAPVVAAAPAMQPIFVQAPEAPRPRGNRAAAGAIGVVAALCFAVLYVAASVGFELLRGDIAIGDIVEASLRALGTWTLWVTVAVFFIAFWLLGAIVNRGRWGAWVVFGLLVGFASYGGHLLGTLFQEQFWMITASEGARIIENELYAPLAIAAFIIGRELTIWFGAWAAARGRRVTELNLEAQHEYERTLEAGPQLVRQ
ncbi:ABC transporter [Microbacterium pumilum]|uniref:ABC transporter n=1 Tax=Microbacterium pumilum TaxID=344165 RepID=A0ABN2S8H9_9MICO